MSKDTLDDLRAKARAVEMPQEAQGRVLEAARGETTATGDSRRSKARPLTRRRFVVRAGAIAAGAVLAMLGGSILMRKSRGNWFALTAYAEGTEQSDGTRLVNIVKDGTIGWAGGTTDDADPWSEYLQAHIWLDFACEGNGIKTLTYSLEGENVIGESARDDEPQEGVYILGYNTDGLSTSAPVSSFTVDYANQDLWSFWNLATGGAHYEVWAHIPKTDELNALFAELDPINEAIQEQSIAADDDKTDNTWETVATPEQEAAQTELMNQISVCAAELLAAELAELSFVMTAEFEDGSTQVKRYRMEPRGDFAEVYGAWDEAGHEGDAPALFLVSEVEG